MKVILLRISCRGLICLFLVLFISSCFSDSNKKYEDVNQILQEVKQKFAPDKRVAIFDIKVTYSKSRIVLEGEVDNAEAVKELVTELEGAELEVENKVAVLPDSTLGSFLFGVVNNSVANLRSEARHSGELATQATLGTELKILKRLEEWYLVQTPDKYIAWIDHGGLQVMNHEQIDQWRESNKIIYLKPYGNVMDDESRVVGDLTMGCSLKMIGEKEAYFQVEYPDGRVGNVLKSESQAYEAWLKNLDGDKNGFKTMALSLLGSPYLWGGTSSKAMDCSGFTKTIYFMNGLVIPRDASQQVNEGMVVDSNLSFEGLEIGDLLFFGKLATDSTRQKTTHVGLWIGEDQFIHASQKVRISSIDKSSPLYDSMNVNRYLGGKRYFDNLTEGILPLKSN